MSASDNAGSGQPEDYVMISDDDSDVSEVSQALNEQPGSAATSYRQILLEEELTSFTVKEGVNLHPRRTVELKNGDFLRIESLHRKYISGEVMLQGPRFRRTKRFRMMEKQLNEVCWLVDVNLNDDKSLSGQDYKRKAYNSLHLVCRTKYIRYFSNSEVWRLGECREFAIERLSEQEADESYRFEDAALKRQWRETAVLGAAGSSYTEDEDRIIRLLEEDLGISHILQSDEEVIPIGDIDALNREAASITEHVADVDSVGPGTDAKSDRRPVKRHNMDLESDERATFIHDLTSDDSSPPTPERVACDEDIVGSRYTFGDAYCGGGGSSRGAADAGLDIKWGVDRDINCASTYACSFPGAAVHASVDQFCQLQLDDHRVDVLHLFPPCQPYSGAHTWEGKDDEVNTVALFGVGPTLRKARCRIAMLEEASGLLAAKHSRYFNALVNLFLVNNFSIRWTIKNFADYGLPQPRKRLVIFASCPGEALPEFPTPTHSNNPASGLKRYTTIHRAIKHLQPGDYLHNLDTVCERDEEPYSAHTQLQRAVMCGGTTSYHPSGQRDFTVADLAALQTFTLKHRFGNHSNTVIRRQIGNAVPPAVWKIFCQQVIDALKKADGVKDT